MSCTTENDLPALKKRKLSAGPDGEVIVKQELGTVANDEVVDTCTVKIEQDNAEPKTVCGSCVRGHAGEVFCFECGRYLCAQCHNHHKYSIKHQGHIIVPLLVDIQEREDVAVKPKSRCQEHHKKLKFFCDNCNQLACRHCIKIYHLDHQHDTVKKMATKYKEELEKMQQSVDLMMDGFCKTHTKICYLEKKLDIHSTMVDKQIDQYYELIYQRLQQQKCGLKEKLFNLSFHHHKAISAQKENLENAQAQLKDVKSLGKAAIESEFDKEILPTKKQVSDQMEELTGYFHRQLDTEAVQSISIHFIPNNEHDNDFPEFGQLYVNDHASDDKVGADDQPEPNLQPQLTMTLADSPANSSKGISQVDSQEKLTSDVAPLLAPLEVLDSQHGMYKDLDFAGPDRVVNCGGMMGTPFDVALGKDGVWAITDVSNSCIWVLDDRDRLIGKFGSKGRGNDQFIKLRGLAFDANNHLYVADFGSQMVKKFGINGQYLLQFDGKKVLEEPVGITVCNFLVYVANHKFVSVFHSTGQFIQHIGSKQLKCARDVKVSSSNLLYVTDCCSKCIQVYSLEGQHKFRIGAPGGATFRSLSAIAVDPRGVILVTGRSFQYVAVYNQDGDFLCSLGTRRRKLCSPQGVAIGPTGSVYVIDGGNKRILIFSSSDTRCVLDCQV